LLVVIAIIALLMALLLPALQKVRAASENSMCRNNLSQIAVACHNFHNDLGFLPPGVNAPPSNTFAWNATRGEHVRTGQSYGSLTFLLPYLDGKPYFDQLATDGSAFLPNVEGTGSEWINSATAQNIARITVKAFICPSDDKNRPTLGVLLGMWSGQFGPGSPSAGGWGVFWWRFAATATFGKTNYAGNGGRIGGVADPTRDREKGVIYPASRINLNQVAGADGAAGTYLFGEIRGGVNGSATAQVREYYACWMGWGWSATSTSYGFGDLPVNGNDQLRFNSNHIGGVNFAFCDRSIRTVKRNIAPQSHVSVSAYADGVVENVSSWIE
jgi:type II secretory pathway pseudopilin PulG